MSEDVAIVTGIGRGIGRAITHALCDAGISVLGLDCDPQLAEATAARSGGRCTPVTCDVRDRAKLATFMQRAAANHSISILVNNAGIGGPFHRIDQVSDDEWDLVMETNLRAVFDTCRRVLPAMRERNYGRIVNIASIQGMYGAARSSTYVASKHGVIGYTRAIAAEWGAYGVTCNAICPGYIDTAMGAQDDLVDDHSKRIAGRTPTGRLGTPQEVAALVMFLVGPGGGYTNGSIMTMDGGITADVGL